jgi:23S rRNA (cytosine1962-C5)-methyltransferase
MDFLDPPFELLEKCLGARAALLKEDHKAALRLFNGFLEGYPSWVVDVFGRTLVILTHSGPAHDPTGIALRIWQFFRAKLPWLQSCVLKTHRLEGSRDRCGMLLAGDKTDDLICENGTWYAIDLFMNQDASFYPDTRNLRFWLKGNARGWQVLNTFAYTGALGIAALAGGAEHVVQVDRSRKFLTLSEGSCALNGWEPSSQTLIAGDFFTTTARFRRAVRTFDCAILDPPFCSVTSKGRVDQSRQSANLINKIRPLVRERGWLVVINNALFISGAEYVQSLQDTCRDGYLSIDQFVEVPPDVTGFPDTVTNTPPTDPGPFNHSTKIALLRVIKRKDQA